MPTVTPRTSVMASSGPGVPSSGMPEVARALSGPLRRQPARGDGERRRQQDSREPGRRHGEAGERNTKYTAPMMHSAAHR